MAWIKGNRYLSTAEMQNNAMMIKAYLAGKGWSLNAIAGLLGNMESESTINPGIWQSLIVGSGGGGGYGLVQWTPWTNYTNWADSHGYAWDDGSAQLKWIDEETETFGQWIPTSAYNFSFSNFKVSLESPEYLASAFLKNFERAGVEVEDERRSQARAWFSFITANTTTFTPRLDDNGIEGKFYWYSQNPFWQSGYGLPNCTCYAWGRFWEISDPTGEGLNRPTLPLGDAGTWFGEATDYQRGQTPELGAVVCWSKPGGAGHVAIVEQILENGDIITSNSAYGSTFFYTSHVYKSNGYNAGAYVFQGFIYNPFAWSVEPIPSGRKRKKRKFNFILYNRQRRWIV